MDKGDPKRAADEACISCMRCIAVCPRGARELDPNELSAVSQMLSKVCVVRKKCELFI
ncbi:4Fe-4S binding protein [Collinsella sp. AM17-1]|uniref:4Fe-4S binding protein n=1 Tax=Collinsella sp. AM17-1 TaxID=2292027 RepID=UPI0035195251